MTGRGNSSGACEDLPDPEPYLLGMCHLYPDILPDNVRIVYQHTGLGFVTRPGGPVPTITVSLRDLDVPYFFLGDLMDLSNFAIPFLTTTITGEDLSSLAP